MASPRTPSPPPDDGNYDCLASVCRESYEQFVRNFWYCVPGAQKLKWNWHMSVICDELQEAAERVFKGEPRTHDTIFNVPPGTSKSSICSILFCAWTWTRMPDARHIVATHTDKLALDLGSKSRWVIKHPLYRACFPEIEMRYDLDTKSHFGNTFGGERMTCTVAGASPTGRHAHFIDMDDPIDPKKALSELALENARHFVTEVIPSRKVNKEVAFTYTVMQRLAEHDPTGVQIEIAKRDGAAPVRLFRIPAEVADEPLPTELAKNYVNELLDPVRLPQHVLDEQLALLGAYGYAAQYGQRPTPRTGGRFEERHFSQRVPAAPMSCRRIRMWDLAATVKDYSANTAGVLLGKDQENYVYVEHVACGKWVPAERNKVILQMAYRDRAKYGPRHEPVVYVEVEPGSGGIAQFQEIARKLMGFRVRMHNPGRQSKEARADPWSAFCASGNLFLVEDGTWDISGYVKEHTLFPLAKLKDRVDASAGAYVLIAGGKKAPDQFRIVQMMERDRRLPLRVIVARPEEVLDFVTDRPSLLVHFTDPSPFGDDTTPPHPLSNLVAPPLTLRFADIDPADWQERWEQPVSGYDRRPEELIMTEEHGRQLWLLLTRRGISVNPEFLVLLDEGNRAESAAHAVCHCLRIPRNQGVFFPGDPDRKLTEQDQPPNRHVFDVVKTARSKVIL